MAGTDNVRHIQETGMIDCAHAGTIPTKQKLQLDGGCGETTSTVHELNGSTSTSCCVGASCEDSGENITSRTPTTPTTTNTLTSSFSMLGYEDDQQQQEEYEQQHDLENSMEIVTSTDDERKYMKILSEQLLLQFPPNEDDEVVPTSAERATVRNDDDENSSVVSDLSDDDYESSLYEKLYNFDSPTDLYLSELVSATHHHHNHHPHSRGRNTKVPTKGPVKSSISRKSSLSNSSSISTMNKQQQLQQPSSRKKSGSNSNLKNESDERVFEFDFRVSFKNVYVRKYSYILGDNPACSSGPSLSISWDHHDEQSYTVDEWEYNRDDIFTKDLIDLAISSKDRLGIVRKLGYSDSEIKSSIQEINTIKAQRMSTAKSSLLQKTGEVFVTVKFRLNRMLKKRMQLTSGSSTSNTSHTHASTSTNTKCNTSSKLSKKDQPFIVGTKAA